MKVCLYPNAARRDRIPPQSQETRYSQRSQAKPFPPPELSAETAEKM